MINAINTSSLASLSGGAGGWFGVNPQSSLTRSSPVMSLRVIHRGFEPFCELMQDELHSVGGRLPVMPWTKHGPFAMKFRFEKICVSALKRGMSNKPFQRVE